VFAFLLRFFEVRNVFGLQAVPDLLAHVFFNHICFAFHFRVVQAPIRPLLFAIGLIHVRLVRVRCNVSKNEMNQSARTSCDKPNEIWSQHCANQLFENDMVNFQTAPFFNYYYFV